MQRMMVAPAPGCIRLVEMNVLVSSTNQQLKQTKVTPILNSLHVLQVGVASGHG